MIKYSTFRGLYGHALEAKDLEMYIAECTPNDWLDTISADTAVEMMTLIHELAHQDLSSHRQKLGMSQTAFARWIGISPRTIQNWEIGHRSSSDYLQVLIAYAVFSELSAGESDGTI